MYENGEDVKLVGVVDLLVVDKLGRVRLYDFKTSPKTTDLWANEKQHRMR